MLAIEPPPISTPLVLQSGLMQRNWIDWLLLALLKRLQGIAYVRQYVSLTNQHAAIGATALIPSASAGYYRISWRVRISTVDGIASSVTVTINSTEGGNAIAQSGAAVNGDTLQTVQSGEVYVTADPNSLISYATAYASNTPAAMGYAVQFSVEQVN